MKWVRCLTKVLSSTFRIWVCLNKANFWFEFKARFSQCSCESFHRVLVSFISFLFYLYLIFRGFSCVFMSKMPSLLLQMESCTECLEILIFLSFSRKSFVPFSIFLFMYFGMNYCIFVCDLYTIVFHKKHWLKINFSFSNRVSLY